MNANANYVAIARAAAPEFGLDPSLVCAVIEQESAWVPTATRYEPAFFVRYIEPLIHSGELSDMQEAKDRATSWGLMQVLLQTAREMGFTGPSIALTDPETGIVWGCRKLQKCFERGKFDTHTALLRYNGGSNLSYPLEVAARVNFYKNTEEMTV